MEQQQLTEEQIETLQEKIKNMTPEELKEFQKKQCIFCQIVSEKIATKKIYDDSKCLAILDINPASPGHMLLLPKEHYTVMPQMPEDELTHIFMVAKSLSNAVLKSLDARGTNIIVANGPAAGQKAQHFMLHIIPRKEKDGIQFNLPQRRISENDLKIIREKLSKKVIEVIGAKKIKKKEISIPEAPKDKKTADKPKKQKKARKTKKQEKEADINLDDVTRLLGVK